VIRYWSMMLPRCSFSKLSFVRHLVEKGDAIEAVNFVQRCDSNKRVDLYVECGEWVMAGKECKERGDRARLECVSLAY
jgi:vacuolar protein sorting-associated protein 16